MTTMPGEITHALYVAVPILALAAAYAGAVLAVRRLPAFDPARKAASVTALTWLLLFVALDWLDTAPITSDMLLAFIMPLPWLAFAVSLALSVTVGVVVSLVHLVRSRTAADGAALGAAALIAIAAVGAPALLHSVDLPAKRLLRERVVAQMLREGFESGGRGSGGWNARLPAGWAWLSMNGEVSWEGTGTDSEVTFCDWSGIMRGGGYVYTLDGSRPTEGLGADYLDDSQEAPGWYSWYEPN
jgi:hypothetical protein